MQPQRLQAAAEEAATKKAAAEAAAKAAAEEAAVKAEEAAAKAAVAAEAATKKAAEKKAKKEEVLQLERINVFYNEATGGRYVPPRAVLCRHLLVPSPMLRQLNFLTSFWSALHSCLLVAASCSSAFYMADLAAALRLWAAAVRLCGMPRCAVFAVRWIRSSERAACVQTAQAAGQQDCCRRIV